MICRRRWRGASTDRITTSTTAHHGRAASRGAANADSDADDTGANAGTNAAAAHQRRRQL